MPRNAAARLIGMRSVEFPGAAPSPVVSAKLRPFYAGFRADDFLPDKKHREETMATPLTFLDNPALNRRSLMKGAAALAATAATITAASAATVTPFGQTGAPT